MELLVQDESVRPGQPIHTIATTADRHRSVEQPQPQSTTKTRRSHTKSRGGCLFCKARRIKCGEEKPACQNCTTRSRAKTCEYPSPIINLHHRGPPRTPVPDSLHVPGTPTPPLRASISAVTDTFTLRDLRLFHHFLSCAYPSLPLGNQSIWTHDIPQLIFSHDYLMYALLALGASHLHTLTAPTHAHDQHQHQTDTHKALTHRGHAISGLKRAFEKQATQAQQSHSNAEYDAMLATCYVLAFESALVPNGRLDFATFVRGCAIVTEKIQDRGRESIFKLPRDLCQCPAKTDESTDILTTFNIDPRSSLNQLLEDGMTALAPLQADIAPYEAERNFYLAIYSTFTALQNSPSAGYTRFLSFYAVWFKLADDTLCFTQELISSVTAQLLWAFFLGLQLFITLMVEESATSITKDNPGTMRKDGTVEESTTKDYLGTKRRQDEEVMIRRLTEMIEWLDALSQNMPPAMCYHLQWSKRMAKACERRFKLVSPSPAKVHQKLVTLEHLDVRGHIVIGSILDLSASLSNWTEGLLAPDGTLRGMHERVIQTANPSSAVEHVE